MCVWGCFVVAYTICAIVSAYHRNSLQWAKTYTNMDGLQYFTQKHSFKKLRICFWQQIKEKAKSYTWMRMIINWTVVELSAYCICTVSVCILEREPTRKGCEKGREIMVNGNYGNYFNCEILRTAKLLPERVRTLRRLQGEFNYFFCRSNSITFFSYGDSHCDAGNEGNKFGIFLHKFKWNFSSKDLWIDEYLLL